MTKKDYKLIASAFAELLKPYGNRSEGWGLDRDDEYFCRGIERAAGKLAEKLESTSDGFDINKFLDDCGVTFTLDALGK